MPVDNIVLIATRDPGRPLAHFNDTRIVSLQVLEEGYFLIIGKVVINNYDGDYQDASAWLITIDNELDRADVRIGPSAGESSGAQEISLQATTFLKANAVVDLVCRTFDGSAGRAKLFAVQVDGLREAGV